MGVSLASASICLAVRTPWRSRVSSLAFTRSTAIGSGSATRSSGRDWMVKSAHPRIAACSMTEVTNPPRNFPSFPRDQEPSNSVTSETLVKPPAFTRAITRMTVP